MRRNPNLDNKTLTKLLEKDQRWIAIQTTGPRILFADARIKGARKLLAEYDEVIIPNKLPPEFLEIKTSKEKKRGLDRNEAKIRDAIEAKRVRHDTTNYSRC